MMSAANVDNLKIVQDLLRALPRETLAEHYRLILRTRKRYVQYGFNARLFNVQRSMAKTLAQQELARRN